MAKDTKKEKDEFDDFDALFDDAADAGDLVGQENEMKENIGTKELQMLLKEYESINCPMFVSDLYHVFFYKGRYIKTDDEITKRCEAEYRKGKGTYWGTKNREMGKAQFLANFSKNPFFKRFKDMTPYEATKGALELMRQSAKEAMEDQKRHADKFKNSTVDEQAHMKKFAQKSWEAEDYKEEILFENVFSWGSIFFDDFEEFQHMFGGSGGMPYHVDPRNTGDIIKYADDLMTSIKANDQWQLFRLFKVLEKDIATADKKKTKEKVKVKELSDDTEQNQMTDYEDIANASASDRAMPKGMLAKKIADKSLIVKTNEQNRERDQLIYVLWDTSSSMKEKLRVWKESMQRQQVAKAVMLSLLGRVDQKKAKVYYRQFTGSVGRLHKVTDAKTYSDHKAAIASQFAAHGRTDFQSAFNASFNDIRNARSGNDADLNDLKNAEILMITDGEGKFDIDGVMKEKKALGLKLRVMYVGISSLGTWGENLIKVADSFMKFTGSDKNKEELVDLVTSIKLD